MCDHPSVFRAEARVARKEHTCYECQRVIPAGELYVSIAGKWTDWGYYDICVECEEARGDLEDELRVAGLYHEEIYCELAFGNLREAYQNAEG